MVSLFYISVSITGIIIILLSLISSNYPFFEAAQAHSVTIRALGNFPIGIAHNTANNNIYVANYDSNTVSVISGSTDSVIGSILVGRNPVWIAYAPPPSNKLYVTNEGSQDVYVINGATNKVIKNIPVGDQFGRPWGIAYDSSSNNTYVANSNDGTVSVINQSTDTVISTITLPNIITSPASGLNPHFLASHPFNQGIYVGASGLDIYGFRRGQVSAINTATNADVKDMRCCPLSRDLELVGLAYNVNNNRIYVTEYSSNGRISRLNPDTNEFEGGPPIRVGSYPFGIVHNPSNNKIYVTNTGSDTVSVIDPTTNSVNATIPIARLPTGIAYNTNNNHIYVANSASNTVSVIHP
jgi:YVTN family beta-propeller protein